ncbi:hypothetical protein [Nostoc sp. T09]|uniref:hypothetical protein n=1 Tax=Nostoc sp. T09 TaxID=1932621 RepID=UPI00211B64FF|nr:hypothetical protein [Nostoc sp. T09]
MISAGDRYCKVDVVKRAIANFADCVNSYVGHEVMRSRISKVLNNADWGYLKALELHLIQSELDLLLGWLVHSRSVVKQL